MIIECELCLWAKRTRRVFCLFLWRGSFFTPRGNDCELELFTELEDLFDLQVCKVDLSVLHNNAKFLQLLKFTKPYHAIEQQVDGALEDK